MYTKLLADVGAAATIDWVLGGLSPAGLNVVHRQSQSGRKILEIVLGPQHAFLNKASLTDLVALMERIHAQLGMADRVIVRSSGKFFGVGTSIPEHVPPLYKELIPLETKLIALIASSVTPVVARVHGMALGGPFDVATACHLNVLELGNPAMGVPQVKLGVPASDSATMLPRIVGPERALLLLLTGETRDATQLHGWGLVQSRSATVLSESEFDERVERLITDGKHTARQNLLLNGPADLHPDQDVRAAEVYRLAAEIREEENLPHSRPVMDMIAEMVIVGWSNLHLAEALARNGELYDRAMRELKDPTAGLQYAAAALARREKDIFPPSTLWKHA